MRPTKNSPEAMVALTRAEHRERERAEFWLMVPLPVRHIVMMVARLPRDRANESLLTFTAAERHHIGGAITVLSSHLPLAQLAMRDTSPALAVLLH